MKQVIKRLLNIKNTQGTNAKISLLNGYKSDILLKDTLNLVYNPHITTKLAMKKIEKEVVIEPNVEFENASDFLSYLQNRSTGKDIDIANVQSYISKFDEAEQYVLKEIATQTLSIGLDLKGIYKALEGDFVSVINPMLAYKYENRLDKIKEGTKFSASLKLDGFRVLIFKEEDKVYAYSRNGLILEGFDEFLEAVKPNLLFDNCVYDGELLTQKVYADSKEGYKAVSKIARLKGNKPKDELCFNCFDIISLEQFKAGESGGLTYAERRKALDKLNESDYFKIVPSLGVFEITDKELYHLLDAVVENGGEGVMLNQLDSVYECKRSNGILKMKKFYTCDLRVIDIQEGTGTFKGMLGAVIVDYKGNKLGVGSGFTLEDRKHYWENPYEILGKIIEMSYFEETQNKDGLKALRFPVFKNIRTDKDTVSYE